MITLPSTFGMVYHSTETALLKIQNDIATSMDKETAVGLVLLDLSAALDTIDPQSYSTAFSITMALMGLCLSGFSNTLTLGNRGLK